MKVLVLNVGSSSVKFQIVDTKKKIFLIKGIVDAIGLSNSKIDFEINSNDRFSRFNISTEVKNVKDALTYAFDVVESSGFDLNKIKVVAHRVVHGGKFYYEPTLVNKSVLKNIKKLSDLAPLHNPSNVKGIEISMKRLPKAKHVAIFDTAFHHTLPEEAFLYGLPIKIYKKYGIRKYGFHGTSHFYVSKQAIKILRRKNFKLITCHLGNGISVTAVDVRNGVPKSLDTSMGLTPLEGPIMGTRSGTLDPGILIYLMRKGYSAEALDELLNKESGLLGISGLSSDMRDILKTYNSRNSSKLAVDLLSYQLAKIIASYSVSLSGIDAIVFTAGIGEGSWFIRQQVCNNLKHFNVILDSKKNKRNEQIISSKKSGVKVLVIKTNEELEMAVEAEKLLSKN